jgi:hypothetical protein
MTGIRFLFFFLFFCNYCIHIYIVYSHRGRNIFVQFIYTASEKKIRRVFNFNKTTYINYRTTFGNRILANQKYVHILTGQQNSNVRGKKDRISMFFVQNIKRHLKSDKNTRVINIRSVRV